MATLRWIGNAAAVAQVVHLKPANPEPGDLFTAIINGKSVSYEAVDGDGLAEICTGLADAIEASTEPEFREITAEAGTDDDGDNVVILTGQIAGKPFTVTTGTTDGGELDVTISTITPGVAETNEKQRIAFAGTPTGGTWDLTFAGQTASGLAYDITAFALRDELCDLSNIAGTDEVQELEVTGASSGDFTLTFDGQTTAAIAHDASAATVQSALEALSNIEPGDVVCTGGALGTNPVVITFRANLGRKAVSELVVTDSTDGTAAISTTTPGVDSDVTVTGSAGGPYVVEFGGAYAGTNVPLMTADGSSLTGGNTITHATTTQGSPSTNEIQEISFTGEGNYQLSLDSVVSPFISHGDTLNRIRSVLEDMSNIGVGNVSLTPVAGYTGLGEPIMDESITKTYRVEFTGTLAGQDMGLLARQGGSLDLTISVIQTGSATGVDEVQTITLSTAPTGGTWTITFQGQTTGNLDHNADAATVKSELESLSNIDEVTVVRSGSGTVASPYKYTITFVDPGDLDVQQMTSTASSLTGMGISISVSQASNPGTDEVQLVTIDDGAAGGTFTLTYSGQVTAAIAYNASAATVEAALEALSNIEVGEVEVAGPDGGPYTVVFRNGLGAQDVAELTGDGSNLTGGGTQALTATTITAATGPHHADNVKNYSTGALPANGDTLIFEHCDVSMLYALDQLSSVVLTNLRIKQSFTGHIGLPVRTGPLGEGYHEYRPQYLQIGATNIFIGEGAGSGSGRIKLDLGSAKFTAIVEGSGQPAEIDVPAIIIKGTHAENALTVTRGNLGVAVFGGETATIATLLQGYQTDPFSDTDVFLGAGCTLTTITKTGGTLEVNSNVTTLTSRDGETTITAGAVTTLKVEGGRTIYNSTGTLTTGSVSGNGVLDFSQDDRAKTVTNPIDVFGSNADVLDPKKVVAALVIDWNRCGHGKILNLGEDIRITRGATA